jgi:hypothetical protein
MVQNQSMHNATSNRARESGSGAKSVKNLAFPPAVFSPASSYFRLCTPHKGKARNTIQPNNFVSKAKLNQPLIHSRSEEITMQKVFRSSVLTVLLALPLASSLQAASHRGCSSEGTRSFAGPGVPFPKLPPPPPAVASTESAGPGVPFPKLPPPPSAALLVSVGPGVPFPKLPPPPSAALLASVGPGVPFPKLPPPPSTTIESGRLGVHFPGLHGNSSKGVSPGTAV